MRTETEPKTTESQAKVRATPEEIRQRINDKKLVFITSLPVRVGLKQEAESKATIEHYREWAGPENVEVVIGPKGGVLETEADQAVNVYVVADRWVELHLDEFAEQASQQHQPQ